ASSGTAPTIRKGSRRSPKSARRASPGAEVRREDAAQCEATDMKDPADAADAAQRRAERAGAALFARDRASQTLGMRITGMRAGWARVAMTVRADMVNGHAVCHGGIVFALADSAFAFACNSRDESTLAAAASDGFDTRLMLEHAREVGGGNLRRLTFHERAALLKALARYLTEHKEELYTLSYATGATKGDSWIDIDGGIGTLFVYASKGMRELPDSRVYVDGGVEALSKSGGFVGQHICTPLEGAAVHINAFNFPVWGMLE